MNTPQKVSIIHRLTVRSYTVCIFQGTTCVERVREVKSKRKAQALADYLVQYQCQEQVV